MHGYELCVFDMDGVLVDTSACHRQAYERLWQRCGIAGPAYDEIAGRRTWDVVRERTASLHPSPRQIEEWAAFKQAEARALLASADIVYDDTLSALRTLQERRLVMAVATGASRASAELVLERTRLRGFFRTLVTAEDVTRGKPDPEIFQCVIARAGSTPERCVIVEDSLSGIDAAIACGAAVVCVRSGLRRAHTAFLGTFPTLRAAVDAMMGMAP
jgi:HAD superfamily hydrolase (TIGR01509 family)